VGDAARAGPRGSRNGGDHGRVRGHSARSVDARVCPPGRSSRDPGNRGSTGPGRFRYPISVPGGWRVQYHEPGTGPCLGDAVRFGDTISSGVIPGTAGSLGVGPGRVR
jgi:hypothetical protein